MPDKIIQEIMDQYSAALHSRIRQIIDPPKTVTHVDMEATAAPKPPLTSTHALAWGATKSQDFINSVLWIQDQLGLDASDLMACMKFESNLDAKARNPESSASGLIQFMSTTAKRLGTTIEAIRKMDEIAQLNYVYKYFKDYADRGADLSKWDYSDIYMAILWPAGIGKPMSHPIFINDPAKLGDSYDVNKGLDTNKDNRVTKGEAAAKILALLEQGLKSPNVYWY